MSVTDDGREWAERVIRAAQTPGREVELVMAEISRIIKEVARDERYRCFDRVRAVWNDKTPSFRRVGDAILIPNPASDLNRSIHCRECIEYDVCTRSELKMAMHNCHHFKSISPRDGSAEDVETIRAAIKIGWSADIPQLRRDALEALDHLAGKNGR